MRRYIYSFFMMFASVLLQAQTAAPQAPSDLPKSVKVGGSMAQHVQGMAIDREKACLYLSFTDCFLKTDYEGNILASIDSINGHLGAMTFDARKRKVYASLECKDDVIGRNISQNLGAKEYTLAESVFYIAEIDVDRWTMKQYEVIEATKDYKKKYGCSGIDGMAIAPAIGGGKGNRLYVAYGIYGDISRTDNDHQVILEYKPGKFKKALNKYFVYTGNTNWGVQNMAYDPLTGNIFLAVYKGKKPGFPNYDLFAVPVSQKPVVKTLKGLEDDGEHPTLALADMGVKDGTTGLRGWRFAYGSTGFCTVGDGWWLFAQKTGKKKKQGCRVVLYRWTGNPSKPFEQVE